MSPRWNWDSPSPSAYSVLLMIPSSLSSTSFLSIYILQLVFLLVWWCTVCSISALPLWSLYHPLHLSPSATFPFHLSPLCLFVFSSELYTVCLSLYCISVCTVHCLHCFSFPCSFSLSLHYSLWHCTVSLAFTVSLALHFLSAPRCLSAPTLSHCPYTVSLRSFPILSLRHVLSSIPTQSFLPYTVYWLCPYTVSLSL